MDETLRPCRYRILRYVPNLLRDEWVNVGVLLEEPGDAAGGNEAVRREVRLIEEDAEIARVRRLHPGVDEPLLRSLGGEFEARLRTGGAESAVYLEKLDQTLSNTLQFGPQKAVLTDDFEAELERLYVEQVAPPRAARPGVLEGTVQWLRQRVSEVFRRRQILGKLERNVRVAEFTYPGDPLRVHFAYRYNGTRGYMQVLPLHGDALRPKAFAYTAECIRRRASQAEFTALVDAEPAPGDPRVQFVRSLLEGQGIAMVPPAGLDGLAERLRPRLQ